jgi:hypothetical protein
MADKQAQMLVAGILNGMSGISAHHRDSDNSPFLVVECASIAHANNVERIVKWIDPGSVQTLTTNRTEEDALLAS